jgi:2-hydroxy-3-keto-5-methylthiopentenyl-1-phosphate phosphatase
VSQLKSTIFCDFDGTITENDNIIAIMKHFNPPGWEQIVQAIIARNISIQQGVGQMFALLPTSMREEIEHFAIQNAVIRRGFSELLAYCEQHSIDFLVTSGGIDFFIYPLLEPFAINKAHIYCNGSDFSGETIQITWPHTCDEACTNQNCGMCKARIIRAYPKHKYQTILIGDSITDLEGAKLADLVFARSHLIDLCTEHGIDYVPYETFNDVIDHLQEKV